MNDLALKPYNSIAQRVWFGIFFILLLAFAAFIHIAGVYNKGFWLDEILTMKIHAPRMAHWSFPYIRALNGWLAYTIGQHTRNELFLRLPNICASVGTIALIGWWMKRRFGALFSLAVMLSFIGATCFLRTNSLVRSYGFLAFFVTGSCWAADEWIRNPKKWGWILVCVSMGAGIFISRMEGMSVFAALLIVAPLCAALRPPWRKRKFIIITIALVVSVLCAWAASYLIIRTGITSAQKTNILPADIKTYSDFIRFAARTVFAEISLTNLRFALHHTFRSELWVIPVALVLLAGIVHLAIKRTKLLILLLLWIIAGHSATVWLLSQFFHVAVDARHIQFTTPAWCIIFVSGCLAPFALAHYFSSRKWLKYTFLIAGVLWSGIFFVQYFVLLGTETYKYIRYDRIADWKQITALSKSQPSGTPFFASPVRSFELGYYSPEINYKGINVCKNTLKKHDKIYYCAGNMKDECALLAMNTYDVIELPYEPFSVFVIYKNKTSFTQYWRRVKYECENALRTAHGHAQIEELRTTADILLSPQTPRVQMHGEIKDDTHIYSPSDVTIRNGWGGIEKAEKTSFRWSTARNAVLLLSSHSNYIRDISFTVMPYLSRHKRYQEMNVYCGDTYIGAHKISNAWQAVSFSVPLRVPRGENRITCVCDTPSSPAAVGGSGDTRLLAIGLSRIRVGYYPEIQNHTLLPGEPDAAVYLGNAWSTPEKWSNGNTFRWICGTTATVTWVETRALKGGVWKVTALPFVIPAVTQSISVVQNGTVLANIEMNAAWAEYVFPATYLESDRCTLQFIFSYAKSPEEVGIGTDPRELSAAISEIRYEK